MQSDSTLHLQQFGQFYKKLELSGMMGTALLQFGHFFLKEKTETWNISDGGHLVHQEGGE